MDDLVFAIPRGTLGDAMTDEDFKRLLAENAAETRRHLDVTSEAVGKKVELVAEAVLATDRKIEELARQTERGFAETQSMIRFSHAELDRRVRSLEDDRRCSKRP